MARIEPRHREELARFRCAGSRAEWQVEVEEAIQSHLIDHLENHPRYAALGGWRNGELVAIATGEPRPEDPAVWTSNLIAVALGHRRRGYGRRMKEELIGVALMAGARVIVSRVAFDNHPMLELNKALGADLKLERPGGRYIVCTISL